METIVFATGNENKVKEVNQILSGKFKIKSLKDIGCLEDIPETKDTFEGNALQKAQYVLDKYGLSCFAEDSGLEVDALNKAPGVFSARYAGPERNDLKNLKLVLERLKNKSDRSARFRTAIAYLTKEGHEIFEGIAEGIILEAPQGEGGFGYDPIFQPSGYNLSFAQMNKEEKNKISHRGKAMRKFIHFLESKSKKY